MNRRNISIVTQGLVVSRRGFLSHFVVGTAFSTFMGRAWFATLVADCQAVLAGAGILRVKISDFPALQIENGSVRLALNPFVPTNPNVTPFYPVLVNRGAGDRFFTLRTRCSHQGCVVPPFDASVGASVCPCHGSRYAIDGMPKENPGAVPAHGVADRPLLREPFTHVVINRKPSALARIRAGMPE